MSAVAPGERSDGLLRLRKEVVEANTPLNEVARREADLKLRYLPGMVSGEIITGASTAAEFEAWLATLSRAELKRLLGAQIEDIVRQALVAALPSAMLVPTRR